MMSKRILITGAGSGFGLGAAVALAKRGHHVIATVLNDQQAQALSEQSLPIEIIKLDITKAEDRDQVEGLEVDVFFANAALGQTGPVSLIPIDRLRRVFEVNVFATVAITQQVALSMRKRRSGRIVIVSSIGGVRAGMGSGPYTMTKHAIQAFGNALRAELALFGVDVCLINPGPYATGFNDAMANDPGEWFNPEEAAPEDVAAMDFLRKRITVGQLDPQEVVDRYVELAEAESTEAVNFVPKDILERMAARK
jgi:NAD(P)-dependent dehydrogenase (short-subunit alcohol dehydrogenase family)